MSNVKPASQYWICCIHNLSDWQSPSFLQVCDSVPHLQAHGWRCAEPAVHLGVLRCHLPLWDYLPGCARHLPPRHWGGFRLLQGEAQPGRWGHVRRNCVCLRSSGGEMGWSSSAESTPARGLPPHLLLLLLLEEMPRRQQLALEYFFFFFYLLHDQLVLYKIISIEQIIFIFLSLSLYTFFSIIFFFIIIFIHTHPLCLYQSWTPLSYLNFYLFFILAYEDGLVINVVDIHCTV